jgi:sec-independent protein translocase protein TatB
MLDIGFSELLLIAVVALVVVGPKDLPVVLRHVSRLVREIRGIYSGMRQQLQQVMDEAGIDTLRQEVTTVIDLEGKPQTAYDVSELAALSTPIAIAPQVESPIPEPVSSIPKPAPNVKKAPPARKVSAKRAPAKPKTKTTDT